LRFPEVFSIASHKADAIIIPANWPAKRREHWITLLRARAIENQVYIFAVNCVGNIGDLNYSGDSCVIKPDGEIVEMASYEEKLIIYDFQNDVAKYRSNFPVKQDRKVSLYHELESTYGKSN